MHHAHSSNRNISLPLRSHDLLLRSRANLQHLIYAMEHDPSLGAGVPQITSLRRLLSGIELQLHRRPHPGAGRPHAAV